MIGIKFNFINFQITISLHVVVWLMVVNMFTVIPEYSAFSTAWLFWNKVGSSVVVSVKVSWFGKGADGVGVVVWWVVVDDKVKVAVVGKCVDGAGVVVWWVVVDIKVVTSRVGGAVDWAEVVVSGKVVVSCIGGVEETAVVVSIVVKGVKTCWEEAVVRGGKLIGINDEFGASSVENL